MKFLKQFIGYTRYVFRFLFPLLLIYAVLRVIFIYCNRTLLDSPRFFSVVKMLYSGLQQDITTIVLLNLEVLLLLFIYEYVQSRVFLYFIRSVFIIVNSLGFAFNLIDVGYFNFTKHRSDIELLYILKDSLGSSRAIISGFWWLMLLFILLLAILIMISRLLTNMPARDSIAYTAGKQVLVLCLLLVLARGFKERLSDPYTPLVSLQAVQLPAAQNSASTIVYSFLKTQKEVKAYHFFPDSTLQRMIPTSYYIGNPNLPFKNKNVVLFILESFSRGYLLPGDPYKAKTPFLDSLIGKSTYFPHAFAVNYTSTKGIVPILGSIPTLIDEPFFLSPYANLKIQGIGNALKKKGYNTNFFMGAGDDHFSFGKFSHMVGIDRYYSKNDFPDRRQYEDGNWGVFDAPFLEFTADILNSKQQPFLSVMFNLSSHYPFTIPKELKSKFEDRTQLPSQRAISYVDYSLRGFFQKAESAPWFKNTVFVFCADHWFPPDFNKSVYSYVNASGITFFVYDPSSNVGTIDNHVVNQLDVVPTILDLLNYNDVYYGFGRSVFDTSAQRFVINKYENYYYQCISDRFVLGVDPRTFKAKYLYRYKGDSITSQNLLNVDSLAAMKKEEEEYVKAYVQQYNRTLLNRRF